MSPLLRRPWVLTESPTRPLRFGHLPLFEKDRGGALFGLDPLFRDPAALLSWPSGPPWLTIVTRLRWIAVSIFEYPGVVTAMTSLRITGESRIRLRD